MRHFFIVQRYVLMTHDLQIKEIMKLHDLTKLNYFGNYNKAVIIMDDALPAITHRA